MFVEAKTEIKFAEKRKRFFYIGEPILSPHPFLAPMFTDNKRTKTK
jgi:hypothetical protein